MNLGKSLLSFVGLNNKQEPTKPAKKKSLDWENRPTPPFVVDIQQWKRAELSAKSTINPRFANLMLILEKTYNDAFITSQVGNRFGQALSASFVLKDKNGNVDEDATKDLKENPLYLTLSEFVLESTLYGNTLLQLDYKNDKLESELIPRTNINPIKGIFYKNHTDDNGIYYRDQPEYGTWWLEFKNKDPYGMLNKAVPHEIMKRFGQSCWAEHTEVFSIPPMVLKTDTTDSKMLARGKKMMEEGRGRMAYFIVGEDENLDFADQVATKGELYDGLINQCKSELSLLISGAVIGQDTKNGSNAKESSSQDLLWYLVQADMLKLEQQWNTTIIPALVKHGVIKDGLKLEYEKAEDIAQLWKFVSESMGYYDFDPEWLKQKFGIEVTGSKKASSQLNNGLSFFLEASATTEAMTETCCGQVHTMISLANNLKTDSIFKRIFDAEGKLKFEKSLWSYTIEQLQEAFSKGWKDGNTKKLAAFGIDYNYDSPAMLTAYEMNLFRFSAGKTLAQVQALNKAFRNAKSFEDFRISAALISGQFNQNWLRSEYNTAIAVGQSASTYDRLRQGVETYPYWTYRTQDDTRVRLEHQLLDGITLKADDPLWNKIYPPNGWNCRCFVTPKLKSEVDENTLAQQKEIATQFLESETWKKTTKDGFGVNRAVTNEVFTNNQQYVSKVEANKLLSDLKPEDYNLKEVTNKPERTLYEGTIEDFIRDKGTEYFDYNKRKIKFTATDITSIAQNEKELFSELENTLLKPDEMWFKSAEKGKDFNQFMYIKYYKDTAIAIEAELTKEGLTVVNFFKLLDMALRWGLLIK